MIAESIMLMQYMRIQDELEKLNKKILSGDYEFYELKKDIHYFIDFYKEKTFEIFLRGFSDEQKIKEKEDWYYGIIDMLELARYSEEQSFVKNKHIINLFIKSMQEDNIYPILDNTISSHSYKRALYILSYARDTLDYNLDTIDSEIVQKHISDLQEAVDYLSSQFFKKEQIEYKKKMYEKLLSLLNSVKYNKFFREKNEAQIIDKMIKKVQRKIVSK